MQANSWSMIVFWHETKGSVACTGPDVGLDFTDQPAPAPDMPPQPPAGEDEVDHPGYDDPHGDMPVDDEDMPPPQGQHPEPLLSWIQVVILRRSLPEAALRCRCRVANTMTLIWIYAYGFGRYWRKSTSRSRSDSYGVS